MAIVRRNRLGQTGRLTTQGPATYKIPAAGDTPEHFTVHLWPKANTAQTIFRSKAAGEPPLMLAISLGAH